MKKIPVVLGVPRSGTSICTRLLTKMGFEFKHSDCSIDNIFPLRFNPDGYFQRLDLFLLVCQAMKTNFDEFHIPCTFSQEEYVRFENILHSTNGIKEPYLLRFLDQISKVQLSKV